MTAPISKIGSQQRVTRDAGSDGHGRVAKQLDGKPPAEIDPRTGQPRNAKVDEVAKMYERQFLGEMFKAMRSTVAETDKSSMAQDIYKSQRDEQYIDAWSEHGGVGFSNIIYDQVMEKYFGQAAGAQIKKQGMIPLTNRDVVAVSRVENGLATAIVPNPAKTKSEAAVPVSVSVDGATGRMANGMKSEMTAERAAKVMLDARAIGAVDGDVRVDGSTTPSIDVRTVENTEPMPAPTPAKLDTRSTDERIAAGEYFPSTATQSPASARAETPSLSRTQTQTKTQTQTQTQTPLSPQGSPQQTALQVEVRPSPTGSPAKINAPWDATVVQATKLDGSRTAVTLEHGQGLRSTLVFDGVLAAQATPGQKIPRGQSIGTLNQDAKSFLWNLATQVGANEPEEQTAGQD